MSDASSEKQDRILANQAAIIANQAKLEEILANQEKILGKLGYRSSSRSRVATLGVAGQSIVGDRFPRSGVGDKLTDARPDSGIDIEGPHPDRDRIGVTGITSEQRRATVAAEPFLAASVRLPDAKPVLARNDPKAARCGVHVRRCRRSTTTLTPFAMAVAGNDERLGHLESDGSAVAATHKGEVIHHQSALLHVAAGCRKNTTPHPRRRVPVDLTPSQRQRRAASRPPA